jgi:hypothetical protein
VRRVAPIFAPVVLVAALFVALALADEAPAACPSFKHDMRIVRSIEAHGVGPALSCAEIHGAIVRWIDARFPATVAGWHFHFSTGCSCHVADRRLPGGERQRFVFS